MTKESFRLGSITANAIFGFVIGLRRLRIEECMYGCQNILSSAIEEKLKQTADMLVTNKYTLNEKIFINEPSKKINTK